MSELRALIEAGRALRARGEPFVSATVVAVRGSGYRKPGARMLASERAWLAGSISGGCLERDVASRGFWYTRSEPARLITYDQAAEEFGEGGGTGCQGVVDVLIERHEPQKLTAADVLAAAERCIRDESVAVVLSVVRSRRAGLPLAARAIWQSERWHVAPEHAALCELFGIEARAALAARAAPHLLERDDLSILVETLVPPVHLFVFGTGHDASPLAIQAKQLGWSVSVWDASPRSSARERFQVADHYLTGSVEEAVARLEGCERGAAVVMGHHLARDTAAVQALIGSSAPYIGILGARTRTEQILGACREAGVNVEAASARIHAPVGLALRAQTPAEIALSIVAEVQASLAGPV